MPRLAKALSGEIERFIGEMGCRAEELARHHECGKVGGSSRLIMNIMESTV